MKKIIGLDLGTNSIGWALVNEAENTQEKSSIVKVGSRIIHYDNFVKADSGKESMNPVNDFNCGRGLSPNVGRSRAHGARIRLQRYKLRRKHLIKVLKDYGLITDDTLLCEDGKNTTFDTLRLRSLAATQPISLSEFARVLLMINKKRGYKSNRKDLKINDETNLSVYLKELNCLSKVLTENGLTVGQWKYAELCKNPNISLKRKVFYRQDYLDEFNKIWEVQAAAHKELTDSLKATICDAIIFHQRNLKSKKSLVSYCRFESQQKEVIEGGKKTLRTFGCRVAPIASPLAHEVRIWQTMNNIMVNDFVNHTDRVLTPNEKESLHNELSLHDKLSKSAIHKCLKLNEKEYRLNVEELKGNTTQVALLNAFSEIVEKSGHNRIDIKKAKTNDILSNISGVFDVLGIDTSILTFDFSLDGRDFEKQPAYQLWHLLYSYEADNSRSGNEKLIAKLKSKFGISEEYGAILANNVRFQDGYAGLSAKAMKKILPFLREGMKYSDACIAAGYNHSDSITKEQNDTRELDNYLAIIPRNSLRNPVVEKILNQMVNVVNQIVLSYFKEGEHPDEVRIELARELKMSAEQRQKMSKAIATNTKDNEDVIKELKQLGLNNPSHNDIIKYKLYRELKENGHKTLYSNTYIDLNRLFTNEFDIEHIIPKSRMFNDSMANKTLEARFVNQEKNDQTALDYMRTKGDVEFEQYKATVEKLYKDKEISKAKKDNLLMSATDIPMDFLNRDLGNSQYIAREAMSMLRNITRVVTATTGSITSRLREDWQIVDVMRELNWDKYERLNLTYYKEDKNGQRIPCIKDWTKRNDHRHHAMDAITIAFTKPSYIQYLNNLNARSDKNGVIYGIQTKEMEQVGGKLRFKSPMPLNEFRKEVKQQLAETFISLKSKGKVATRKINRGGKQQQVTLVPRGELHNDTMYRMIERVDTVGGKTKVEKIYTKREAIGPNLIINKVIDSKIREILYSRAEQYGYDRNVGDDEKGKARNKEAIKQAFSNLDENPIWLNKEKGIKVVKVRVKGKNEVVALHRKHDHRGEVVLENGNEVPTDYVSTSNNHHVAIYEDENGNYQEQCVSFFVAVTRKLQGLPIIDTQLNADKGWKFVFSMRINEYFVFPSADLDPAVDDICNPINAEVVSRNLFRVQKLSSRDYSFRHHLDTTVNAQKELRNVTWRRIQKPDDLKGIVKVRINHIGQIVKVGE